MGGLADLMRTRKSWTVVILPPVVIHTTPGADLEGLFGLLGDALVQLVYADDVKRMKEFLGLGEREDIVISAGFGRQDLVTAEEELEIAVETVFGEREEAPVMRPAVMFQLCYSACG